MPASKLSRARGRILERRVLRGLLEAPRRAEQVFVTCGRRPGASGWVPYGWLSDLILVAYGRGVESTHAYHLARESVLRLESAGEVEARREQYQSQGKTVERLAWVRLTDAGRAVAETVPDLDIVEQLPPPRGWHRTRPQAMQAGEPDPEPTFDADATESLPEAVPMASQPDLPRMLMPVCPAWAGCTVWCGCDGDAVLSVAHG